jgi:hypothetical protein
MSVTVGQLWAIVWARLSTTLPAHDASPTPGSRLPLPTMDDLITEAAHMPAAAILFAQGTDTAWTPEHLVPLRETVRTKHKAELAQQLNKALDEHFNHTAAQWI